MAAKEISEGLRKQKQLIKDIINPFFKNIGFSKKGVKYIKKLDYFIVEFEIQRQRYNKENGVENFRINMNVYSENSYKFFRGMNFGYYSISGKQSWITTDENTDIDKTKKWLKAELDKLPGVIEDYNDVNEIIEKIDKKSNNYVFLLKDNSRADEFNKWLEETEKNIETTNSEIAELSHKLELLKETRKDNLTNDMEYSKLWSERKTKEIQLERIMRFLGNHFFAEDTE